MKSKVVLLLLVLALVASMGTLYWLTVQVEARDVALNEEAERVAGLEIQLTANRHERDLLAAKLKEVTGKFEMNVTELRGQVNALQSRLLSLSSERLEKPKPVRERLPLKIGELTTVEGMVYKDVTVEKIEGGTIFITHDAGAGTLPVRRLSAETRHTLELDTATP